MKMGEFKVAGAGTLEISHETNRSTGSPTGGITTGFSIGVSWGRHGLVGGVIGRDEAKRLADHIYAALELSK